MERKSELLQSILELAILQEKALEVENVDSFSDLGNKREELIDEMKKLSLAPSDLNEQDKEILRKINQIDEKNNVSLSKIKEQIQQELCDLRMKQKRELKYTDVYQGMYSGRNFDA